MKLKEYFEHVRKTMDLALNRFLPTTQDCPPVLAEAMRYSVQAGGKRVRPLLAIQACEMCGGKEETALAAASALEMIHTYSLIHDDLPALDNDDLRRGLPTCHKKFGEANAILAGDALLTHAFQVLAENYAGETAKALVREAAKAAGPFGMVAGQVADLEGEKHGGGREELEYIHARKTGALITVALLCGGIVAGASVQQMQSLAEYGRELGLAFQISDDILDVTGSTDKMGKTLGKDQEQNKLTFPKVYGLETAQEMAREHADNAIRALKIFANRADILKELALFVVERDH